jgi:hypothetical protein
MIEVTETVFNDEGAVEHTTKQEWALKSRFLNQFAKLPGVTGLVTYALQKHNTAEFEINGVRRKIEIQPKVELVAK